MPRPGKKAYDTQAIDVLTAEEAAGILRVHQNTLKKWLRDGKMKGLQIGREWRISKAEIDRLLSGG